MTRADTKRWQSGLIKATGVALTLLAVAYVAWSLVETGALSSSIWAEPRLWFVILLAIALYSVALSLIGYGWVGLVANASDVPLQKQQALAAYSRSHLFKYLPTNVLHYVSRQALLSRRGISHAAIAWGSLSETVLMVAAAVAISGLIAAPLLSGTLTNITTAKLTLTVAVIAVGLLALVAVGAARRSELQRFWMHLSRPQTYWSVVRAFALCAVFFLLSGTALWITLRWGFGANSALGTVVAIGAASWVLGFITPGASAGIGIREASLIAGLGASGLANETAVLVAVAYRVVTTVGDLVFASIGFLLERYEATPRP